MSTRTTERTPDDKHGPIRIAFFGTPEFAVPTLEALVAASAGSRSGVSVLGVWTQPDRPGRRGGQGRSRKALPLPVKVAALAHHLPVHQPEDINADDAAAHLEQVGADLGVVVAYGQILSRRVLKILPLGFVNVHASLLPRYRGAAPAQVALRHGDAGTGVTLIRLRPKMDAGPIVAQRATPIYARETAGDLLARLSRLGAELVQELLPDMRNHLDRARPQPAKGVTYAPALRPEDGRIDWHPSAVDLERLVRALTPWPGAFCFLPTRKGPRRLQLLDCRAIRNETSDRPPGTVLRADETGIRIATGDGLLVIRELRLEGGRRLDAAAFLRGTPLPVGTRLIGP